MQKTRNLKELYRSIPFSSFRFLVEKKRLLFAEPVRAAEGMLQDGGVAPPALYGDFLEDGGGDGADAWLIGPGMSGLGEEVEGLVYAPLEDGVGEVGACQ